MQVKYSKKLIENINETLKSKNLLEIEIKLSEQDLTGTRKMNDLPNTSTYTNQNQTNISSIVKILNIYTMLSCTQL